MQIPAELEIARGLPPSGCTVAEAERYTRRLATHHYENFNVVSWLLPRRLHQHFYNLYAYCRWADDLGDEISDPEKALALLNEWDLELRDCYAGETFAPRFYRAARNHCCARHSHGAVFRSAHRVSPGPDRAPVRDLERCFRVLPLFGESRGAPGPLSVRVSRCGAAAAFRCDVHGAAAREFLAGRHARPREGPHLHSAGVARRARPYGGRHRAASVRRAIRFADEGTHCADAAIVRGRNAARPQRRSCAASGHRNVQPRRACRARCHRSHWIQHARAQALDPEIEAVFLAGARSRPARVFIHAVFGA